MCACVCVRGDNSLISEATETPPFLPSPHRFNHSKEFFCLINEQFDHPAPPQRKGGFDLFTHGGATYSHICTKINIKNPSIFSSFLYNNCHRNDPPPSNPSPSCHRGDHVLSEVLWRTGGFPVVPVRCLSEHKKVLMLRQAENAGVKRHFLFPVGPHRCPTVPRTQRETRVPRVGSAAPEPGNSGGFSGQFFEIRIRLVND